MITLSYNNLLEISILPGFIINVFFYYCYDKVDFIIIIFICINFLFLFFCGHQKTGEHLLSTYNLKGINILNFENVFLSSRLKLLFHELPLT